MGDDEDETMSNIQEGDWEFCDEFKHVSEDCKDFISRLIVYQKGWVFEMKKIKNISLISEVEWVQINAWHTHGSKISPKIEVANFLVEARFEDELINSDGGK